MLAAVGCGGSAAPRNVVLISLDTTRADHIGAYGGRAATPRIDALAADGRLFARAYTTNPLTLPAHSTMLTGTIPPVHGVHRNGSRLGDTSVTLAERLRARGMATAGFIGSVVLEGTFGISQGFDIWGDQFRHPVTAGQSPYVERRASEVSDAAVAWLESNGRERPFFLFVHYFDPHQPYRPPEPFASRYADDLYSGEIAYTDTEIGRVLDALARLGLRDSTLVVVTADHGQMLGEHGEETHGFFAYEAAMRVPLVMQGPGVDRGRVEPPVGLVDVAPTILGLLGEPSPAGLDGVDVGRPPPAGRRLYLESYEPTALGCEAIRGLVDGDWKLLVSVQSELFDVVRDPAEADNLAGRDPDRLAQMAGALATILDTRRPLAVAAGSDAVDDRTAARLRALGYIAEAPVTAAGAAVEGARACFPAFVRYQAAQAAFYAGRLDEARREVLAALAARPNTINARFLLASIEVEQKRWPEATAELERFLAGIGPVRRGADTALPAARAYTNLGIALRHQGRAEEAKRAFESAIALVPGFAEAHNNLGQVLREAGRSDEAVREFRTAIEAEPAMRPARRNLARALAEADRQREAADAFAAALALDPGDHELRIELAGALLAAGDPRGAVARLREGLDGAPTTAVANALAWVLASCPEDGVHDPREAVRIAEEARVRAASDPALLDTLAVGYAALGRFADAAATAEQAQAIARGGETPELADAIAQRLALYRRSQPYRQACIHRAE